jgi:hypothetical protein
MTSSRLETATFPIVPQSTTLPRAPVTKTETVASAEIFVTIYGTIPCHSSENNNLKQRDRFWWGSLSFVSDNGYDINREFVQKEIMHTDQVMSQAINQYTTIRLFFFENIVTIEGVWIGWLDLLTSHTINSYLQAMQDYRWFTQFKVHRYTRTKIPILH